MCRHVCVNVYVCVCSGTMWEGYLLPSFMDEVERQKKKHSQWLTLAEASKGPLPAPDQVCRCPGKSTLGLQVQLEEIPL